MTDAADSITGTGHAPGRGGLVIDPPRPREPALGEAAFGDGAPFGGEAPFDEAEVPLYYSRKTADILHKYGPGPRVHFHLGMFESTPNTTVAQHLIRRRITDSQEAVIRHAAATWSAADHPPATLLDIGCGLGGGSIYWAQEHGSTVTGLTITADHIPVMDHLVRRAGVRDRVTPSWVMPTRSGRSGRTTPPWPWRAPCTWTGGGSSPWPPGPCGPVAGSASRITSCAGRRSPAS